MPDLDHDLNRLAPEVDLAASRDLFERRRARSRRAGRARFAAVAAAIVLVLGIGVTAVVATGQDTTLDVGGAGTSGPTPGSSVPPPGVPTGAVTFEVLAMEQAGEPMGTLRAAVDPAGLDALWTGIGFAGDPPPVDLTQWVVVSMTIPDDACPPTLTGFDREGSMLTPVFVEPQGGCEQPLVPKTFVVAIARSSVEPRFTLRLPGWDSVSDPYGEQRLDVEVPPLGDPSVGAESTPAPATGAPTSTSPPPADGELLAAVPLPPAGEARSSVLVDGTPIWVVHHPDGTASALPAVVADRTDLALDDDGFPRGLWSFVAWRPGGQFVSQLVGQGTWDAWGRAIDDGSGAAADLTGFSATVDGDQVIVRRSSAGAPPGDPVVASEPLDDPLAPTVPPLLPDPTVALPMGWVQLDLRLVADATGDVRLCSVTSPGGGGPPPACPAGSRSVPGLTTTPGIAVVVDGPLLVRSDGTGLITAVAVLGAGESRYPNP